MENTNAMLRRTDEQERLDQANQGIYPEDYLSKIVSSFQSNRKELRILIEDIGICYLSDTFSEEREAKEKKRIRNTRNHRRRINRRSKLDKKYPDRPKQVNPNHHTGNTPINKLIDRLAWVWRRYTGKEPGESINNNRYRNREEREREGYLPCGGPFISFVLQVYEPFRFDEDLPEWDPDSREVAIRFRLKWWKKEQKKIPQKWRQYTRKRVDYFKSCPLSEFRSFITNLP
jgi:hypothetical protein